ncbi:hypothetical protein [Geminicoccus flavidas]|uniref:hypothetical protein n=1 Tax=Geminicoccus flavidas TaxID=2506407 RepID=UPI001356F153|nr:hypothetical protein [Geminicoccus flavidas]
MTLSMPVRRDVPQHDLPDVDFDRLSHLMERIDQLSAQITDAGLALRSLVGGRQRGKASVGDHGGPTPAGTLFPS